MTNTLSRTLLSATSDGDHHTLESFFNRPKKLLTGTWTETQTTGQVLQTINIPFDALKINVFNDKLRGFLGFRAKAVIRLTANATRFQQGRLLMNFFPQNDVNVLRHDMTNYTTWGSSSVIYASQLPRVEFDPSNDTDIILEVPYVTDNLYFNLISGEGSAGIVNIIVYSPLVDSTGVGAVNYTVFVHFEDVELVFPTFPAATLFTQAGRGRGRRQVNGSKDIAAKEASKARTGPISSTMGVVVDIANALVKVPMLSSIAAPVSWFASATANAASFFGFSKPLNIASVVYVNNNPHRNAINGSGTDASYNLGLLEDNAIQMLPSFAGTDIDEMHINHIISIPCYWKEFTWTTSQLGGTLLNQFPCNPMTFYQTAAAQNVNGVASLTGKHPTPLYYVCNLFKFYRGSIKFTFKMIKTEFHSGRLLVVFGAGHKNNADMTYDNTTYAHREIIDIRESTEFSFVCPFASTRPYLSCNEDNNYGSYGWLQLWVLNELVAPATVSQSVNILLEISAADDFEVAIPAYLTQMPLCVTPPTVVPYPGPIPGPPPLVTQAGDDISGVVMGSVHDPKTVNTIGSSRMVTDGHESSAYCIGEKIVSLRTLLKRAIPYLCSAGPRNSTIPNVPLPMTIFAPPSNRNYDYIDYIAPLYGLFRGSMRVKKATNNTYQNGLIPDREWYAFISDNPISSVSQVITATDFNTPDGSITHPIVPYSRYMNTLPEYQIPYYSSRHVSVNTIGESYDNRIGAYHRPTTKFNWWDSDNGIDSPGNYLSRCIGEDFSYGYFISTVPLYPIRGTDASNITI